MAVNFSGAITFDPRSIDAAVKFKRPGVYKLGYTNSVGTFIIERVGRSDTDLAARLKSSEYAGRFKQFKASYCDNADEAFHAECELWHRFGTKSGNPVHPATAYMHSHTCRHC